MHFPVKDLHNYSLVLSDSNAVSNNIVGVIAKGLYAKQNTFEV